MVDSKRRTPAALRPGNIRYPLYRMLFGPQGRSGRARKISPPTGIRSPDRQACSKSLYWLNYRGQTQNTGIAVLLHVEIHGLGFYGDETSELHETASSLRLLYAFVHSLCSWSAMLVVRRLGNCDQINVYVCTLCWNRSQAGWNFVRPSPEVT